MLLIVHTVSLELQKAEILNIKYYIFEFCICFSIIMTITMLPSLSPFFFFFFKQSNADGIVHETFLIKCGHVMLILLPTCFQNCQKLSEDVQNAILAVATVYYWLPKGQGTTLRKMVRDATTEVVEGMIQLTETILISPLESLSQEQLISTGGVWEACEQVSNLPRNNQAAVVSALAACLSVVKDALEEMENALVEGQDPYSDITEDEDLGFRGNRDTYWSEADRKLLSSCMGLIKASKACLKKVLSVVKAYGKAESPEHIAQLDDLADIANEISPSSVTFAYFLWCCIQNLPSIIKGAKISSNKPAFIPDVEIPVREEE
uniref:Cyclin D1 binding protein 1 n=1 Tax=Anas zonorhyncha TaxID=75864 RepID=A0A8B9UYD4_9AVES